MYNMTAENFHPPFLSFDILHKCALKIEAELQEHFFDQVNEAKVFKAEKFQSLYVLITLGGSDEQSDPKNKLQKWLKDSSQLYKDIQIGCFDAYCLSGIPNYSMGTPNLGELTILINYYILSVLHAALLTFKDKDLELNSEISSVIRQGVADKILEINRIINSSSSHIQGVCQLRSQWWRQVIAGVLLTALGLYSVVMAISSATPIPLMVGVPTLCIGCFVLTGWPLVAAYRYGKTSIGSVIPAHLMQSNSLISQQPKLQFSPTEITPLLS